MVLSGLLIVPLSSRSFITLKMATSPIEVKSNHLFRYPSEWDPRHQGRTKGGYLEGTVHLPKNVGNLRIILSTYSDSPHQLGSGFENLMNVHPTLIHVVRKGPGNRRLNDREPVPNLQHWQQELLLVDGYVFIRNKASAVDESRYPDIKRIRDEDKLFPIGAEMTIKLGKGIGELNSIILMPKTEKRSSPEDVSLKKLLESRAKDPDVVKLLMGAYTGRHSINLHKLRLRVEIYGLKTGVLITSGVSGVIFDTASKIHGAMDLSDATPLRSCSQGGRKVVLMSEFGLARDVEPYFQLYSATGDRLTNEEVEYLAQPRDQPGKTVSVSKETIVFITPPQEHAELILQNQWEVKLVAKRKSDGLFSKTKFLFEIVPHDYYTTCIFCHLDPDKRMEGRASLAPKRDHARPGLRKRRMSETEAKYSRLPQLKIIRPNTDIGSKGSPTEFSDCHIKPEDGCEVPSVSVLDPDPLQIITIGDAALNGQSRDIPVVDADIL
jgi:hypothetical protein